MVEWGWLLIAGAAGFVAGWNVSRRNSEHIPKVALFTTRVVKRADWSHATLKYCVERFEPRSFGRRPGWVRRSPLFYTQAEAEFQEQALLKSEPPERIT